MVVVLVFVVCLLIGVPVAFLLGLTGVVHLISLGETQYFGVNTEK